MSQSQRNTTLAEEAVERDIAARWGHDKALRAEFADDRQACEAYHRAIARGARPHVGRSTTAAWENHSKSDGKSKEGASPEAALNAQIDAARVRDRQRASAPAQATDEDEEEDEVTKALRRRFESDAALQAEYAENFGAFAALERAKAAGRVRILGKSNSRSDHTHAVSAPIVAPAAAVPDAAVIAARQQKVVDAWAAAWRQDPALRAKHASADAYIEVLKAKYWRAP